MLHRDPKHGLVPRTRKAPDDWADFAAALGVQLHRFRVERGLSQEQLAYAAGLSRYTYQKFEAGQSAPGTPANPSLRNVMARPLYDFWNPVPEVFKQRTQLVSLDDTWHRLLGIRAEMPSGLTDDELALLDSYYALLQTFVRHTSGDRSKTTVYVSPRFDVVLDAAEKGQAQGTAPYPWQ